MTECKPKKLVLSRLGRRRIEADFTGGRLTSNAGLLLLREVDRRLGLVEAVDRAIPDPRDPRYTTHEQRELLAQRILSIAAGYEDENDHQTLRDDPALQLAAGRMPEEDSPLGSPSTLCRLVEKIRKRWPKVRISTLCFWYARSGELKIAPAASGGIKYPNIAEVSRRTG